MSLVVLMPSRGRPDKAREAIEAFRSNRADPEAKIYAVVDHGTEHGYANFTIEADEGHSGQGMGPALNYAARVVVDHWPDVTIIGFIGDDHRTRTHGFDALIESANEAIGGGLIYGNDMIRGEELPTAVFIDARIVRALGWMALPGAKHLYLDDTWRELGKRMHRLKYLPDVVIEHMHPIAQKADWDEGYARVNDPALYDHDRHVYSNWLKDDLERDAEKALAALR